MLRLGGLMVFAVLALASCKPGSSNVAGTYVQQSVPSLLTGRIVLKADNTFDISGPVKDSGSYEVERSVVRFTFASSTAPAPVSCAIKGDTIHPPQGVGGMPAARFKKL